MCSMLSQYIKSRAQLSRVEEQAGEEGDVEEEEESGDSENEVESVGELGEGGRGCVSSDD